MNELSVSRPGARGGRPPRVLLSLTLLALAACGGSSGGNKGDASAGTAGSGGSIGGGGGVGGVGPGSGTPATGGSSGGGAGASGGGAGAGGGGAGGSTPSPCSDPKFPDSCPARGDVPSICWSKGTICSTIAKCGDQFFSCTTPNAHYDCKEMRCIYDTDGGASGAECGDPNFPVSCPALGEVPKLCWSSGTACSTLVRCGMEFRSCLAPGYRYDCATTKCVPATGGPTPDAGTAQPDASTTQPDASAGDAAAAADAAPTTDAASTDSATGG